MKLSKRTERFECRVSNDFIVLLETMQKQCHLSKADILHDALAGYVRAHFWGWDEQLQKLTDIVDDTDTNKERKRKARLKFKKNTTGL